MQLGFQLEDVDLKISPAMQEVVLRDIPGILSPAAAHKERTEKARMFAELQESYDQDPDSAQGKKAALKLSAERRLRGCAEELRLFLEGVFSSNEGARGDIEALTRQMQELTSRLVAAEALTEAERRQRAMSESITAAAEKRIQELEELLVDVETKVSDALKQKRKNTQLQARIKKLDEALASAEAAAAEQDEKQAQLIAEALAAQERIVLLQDQLKELETSLDIMQAQLAQNQAEGAQWQNGLEQAELRIKTLDAQLENAGKNAVQQEAAAQAAEGIQVQLVETQQTLEKALDHNRALKEELASALEQSEGLRTTLQEAERLAGDKIRDEQRATALTEQNERLARELKELRDGYDQECSTRKQLEKSAEQGARRVQELEDLLARQAGKASELPEARPGSAEVAREVESLRLELQEQQQQLAEEQQSREALETELDEAHQIIDSLGKMVRESEVAVAQQHVGEAPVEREDPKVHELESKLRALESQLEQEHVAQQRLAKAVAAAQVQIAEQDELLARGQAEQGARKATGAAVAGAGAKAQAKPAKPLPHELRPAPKQGAFFRPDWDLGGLPCQSSAQVVKAWETAFNVQTSLEGYPAQYCMAFLVVLRIEKQKQLYLLYRLKQSKHTLVCVPASPPKDEHALEQAVQEGLNFLKMSGFAMEVMAPEHLDSTLGGYFLAD